jgi:hypothetical protein
MQPEKLTRYVFRFDPPVIDMSELVAYDVIVTSTYQKALEILDKAYPTMGKKDAVLIGTMEVTLFDKTEATKEVTPTEVRDLESLYDSEINEQDIE